MKEMNVCQCVENVNLIARLKFWVSCGEPQRHSVDYAACLTEQI